VLGRRPSLEGRRPGPITDCEQVPTSKRRNAPAVGRRNACARQDRAAQRHAAYAAAALPDEAAADVYAYLQSLPGPRRCKDIRIQND
jgi:hypothetical protein